MQRRVVRVAVCASVLMVGACQVHESHAPQESLAASAATGRDFTAILDKGDYAGAIKFVEQSSVPTSEKDGLKGNLILDGWVDPAAVSRPPYPLVTGFDSLERAALAGRSQSITDLRAKFTTGINFEGNNVLMAPNPALAQCWARVEAATEQPATCVALRRQLKVPQG